MKSNRTAVVLGAVVILGSVLALAQTTASCTYTTFQYPGATGTTAYGINDYNSVVGYATLNGSLIGFIRWSNGTFTKVNVPGSSRTLVFGRNNNGTSVGEYLDAKGWHLFFSQVAVTRPSTIRARMRQNCSASTTTTAASEMPEQLTHFLLMQAANVGQQLGCSKSRGC